MDLTPIRSDRFDLELVPLTAIEQLLAGDVAAAEGEMDVRFPAEEWLAHARQGLEFRRADLLRDPSVYPWILRAMVMRDRRVAGYCGFHGPPDADRVAELGYTVFEAYRRQGFAMEAARRMMAAASDSGVRRFRVSISPENAPSLAMAEKLGFVRIGQQMDEIDGLEFVFELPVS